MKLDAWRDAVVGGRLPEAPRTDRWLPLRAGVVNLWEYDAAEVSYADGRLQLQGANESGKSTLMTLTTLLLLAGDTSSHNIDTLGQSEKRFRYYVEPTNHPMDRRDATATKNRGWAWMEFGRDGEYLTLLLFAEARRADGDLKIRWCTAHGASRVRDGLTLAKSAIVAEPSQFRDIDGFTIHPSGTAYREQVARQLYGSDTAWLDQVVRILRVVRTPQIGNRLDLKFLTDAFRIALPPIAEDEINQLADGWEQLQRLRDERDTTEQALTAVTEFTRRRWRAWADAVIRAAADPVATVTSELTQITRDETNASGAVRDLTGKATEINDRIKAENEALQGAEAEREALRESAAYQDAVAAAGNAAQLADRARDAEALADRSRGRADEAEKEIAPARASLDGAEERIGAAEREVDAITRRITDASEAAGLGVAAERYLPAQDAARLRQAADRRGEEAATLRRLLAEQNARSQEAESAAATAAGSRRRAEDARLAQETAERTLEAAITAVAELLADWAAGLPVGVRPAQELLESWVRRVSEMTGAAKPAPVLARAVQHDHVRPVRMPLDRRLAELATAVSACGEAIEAAQDELARVEAERDPRPGEPELWRRRPRPDGVTAEGAPLWRLVDVANDTVSVAELEAALDAMGLLQAWVTPDGVYSASRDGDEIVLTASGKTAEPSLREVLRPADDAGDLAEVVDRALASVAYGTGPHDGEPAVAPGGWWRHGTLTGRAAPAATGARLLGAAARAADRARRIAELGERLADLTAKKARLEAEVTEKEELLASLEASIDSLPLDSQVVTAVLTARQAAATALTESERAEQDEEVARTAATEEEDAAARTAEHAEAHDLPRTITEVDDLRDALSRFVKLVDDLDRELRGLPPLRAIAADAAKALAAREEAWRKSARDAEADHQAAIGARTKADAAQSALSVEAQEIITQVDALGRQITDRRKTLDGLTTDHDEIKSRVIRAQAELEQIEQRRAGAEETRRTAIERWFRCVDSGLPRLRGLADPAARHVTGALESVRAARAAITIRDWPEPFDPAAAAHRVQNQWARMVDAVAELRSRLEAMAGRTVRTVAPGEGDEDFPGSVMIVVDGSGVPLPPPDARETLFSLLTRLQDEYDEELTKTINELLGSTFIEHLRDRLAAAERLRGDINAKLAENPTSTSGLMLRLVRVPVADESAANEVLRALERDFRLLPETTQEQIRRFLSGRITDAQEQARAVGDPDWRRRLAQILDYRYWFELRMEYRTARSADRDGSGGWRRLDRGDHGLLSGGAKVVTLMQPFIAALHAMYDQAGTGPRMIWLDEAFSGVDSTNKATMFRLLASCDLDWLIAGPGIIANSATIPMAAIYEVRRAPQPLPGISLELAVWSGTDLVRLVTPDPADLPDLSPEREPTTVNDGLF